MMDCSMSFTVNDISGMTEGIRQLGGPTHHAYLTFALARVVQPTHLLLESQACRLARYSEFACSLWQRPLMSNSWIVALWTNIF